MKTSKLNLVELIFVQSVLENSIEVVDIRDYTAAGALITALAKVKQQKETALTKKWDKKNP